MIEPKPHSTRLIHWLAGLARWSLGLVLALWLVVAVVWGVLHVWIVPRISEWRPALESLASRSLGIPVTIGSLAARSEGVIPTFELGDMVLHDPQGGQALRLSKVVVAVSAHSLMTLGVEQIYIEAPELTVRRAADGRIFVAGIALVQREGGDNAVADWLFSQPEIALRHGSIQWVDEILQVPALQLRQVDLVLRNKGWNHQLRLDATPPEAWGQRFTLMGRFREPLLSVHEGRIERWSGQLFADFSRVDLSQLGQYLGPQTWLLEQGRGAVRAWVDVAHGQPVGVLADLSVQQLQLQWQGKSRPLQLQSLQGRISLRRQDGYQLAVQGLGFATGDGLQWPSSNFSVRYVPLGAAAQGSEGEHGEVRSDALELAIVSQLLQRLPIPEPLQAQLQALAPEGRLRQLQLSWRGPWQTPLGYKASGQLEQLGLQAQPSSAGPADPGIPGVKNLDARFALDQDKGMAELGKSSGDAPAVLSFPGVFEEPDIAFDKLQAAVRWQVRGQHLAVQVSGLSFGNADAEGQARAQWQTGAGTRAQPRFPGLLDLQGQLSRADGTRVHRYLPLELPEEARHYVREAIVAGQASAVNFKVRGDLEHVPFEKPGQGEFHISARLRDVHYDYVPAYLLSEGEKPWPALTRLSGELVFDRNSMSVNKARGMLGNTQVAVQETQASVADWNRAEVAVTAKAQGALSEMLDLVQGSALSALTGHALDESRATGPARLALQLRLPVEQMEHSRVQGNVALAGNSLELMPGVPALGQIHGNVQFSESGFSLAGVQARALGGELRLEGGMKAAGAGAASSPVQIRVQGLATAQGLREAGELGGIAELARHLQGQARYSLQVQVREGEPEISVQSNLQGMAVDLPEPLHKPAETALALSVSRQLAAPSREQIRVRWADQGAVLVERDIGGPQARITRGSLEIVSAGRPEPVLPESGIEARIQLPRLDLDAWLDLLQARAASASAPAEAADERLQYLPRRLTLEAAELQLSGRQLHNVAATVQRAGSTWSSRIEARQLAGTIEYREGSPQEPAGQVIARLSRLAIPDVQDNPELEPAVADEAPRELPALEIAVEDFRLGQLPLGRVEIQARNQLQAARGIREWQLSRFDITTPEASLAARGQWSIRIGDKQHPGQTQLQFQLTLRDAGQLLKRFEMPGVVANGQGRLHGEVGWSGIPMRPDYRSMTGNVHLDVQRGQFLKADPGLAKLLGVLSLQALPRRLTLDFRDVFRDGFSFDFMRGDVQIANGMARTNNMQMKGVNAAVLMEGSADLIGETQDLHVVVVPEINAMTASLVATAINPVVGLSSFLAQVLLRGPLNAVATRELRIQGSWADPQVSELPRKARSSIPETGGGSPAGAKMETLPAKPEESP